MSGYWTILWSRESIFIRLPSMGKYDNVTIILDCEINAAQKDTIVFRKSLNIFIFLIYFLFFQIWKSFKGVEHGTCLPSHRERADGRQQRFPCKQQDKTSLFAKSAKSSNFC